MQNVEANCPDACGIQAQPCVTEYNADDACTRRNGFVLKTNCAPYRENADWPTQSSTGPSPHFTSDPHGIWSVLTDDAEFEGGSAGYHITNSLTEYTDAMDCASDVGDLLAVCKNHSWYNTVLSTDQMNTLRDDMHAINSDLTMDEDRYLKWACHDAFSFSILPSDPNKCMVWNEYNINDLHPKGNKRGYPVYLHYHEVEGSLSCTTASYNKPSRQWGDFGTCNIGLLQGQITSLQHMDFSKWLVTPQSINVSMASHNSSFEYQLNDRWQSNDNAVARQYNSTFAHQLDDDWQGLTDVGLSHSDAGDLTEL